MPFLPPVHDAPVDALVGGHSRHGIDGRLRSRPTGALPGCSEVLDETLERVRPPIEDEIVGELALRGIDFGVGTDVCGIDDGRVSPAATQ